LRTRSSRFAFVVALLILSAARVACGEDAASQVERLRSAEEATTLIQSSVSPFYLKLSVQLYDAKGKPSEKGTVEEWWAGSDVEKRVYTTPSYSATEVRKGAELFRSAGVSYPPDLLKELVEQVVHPMPSERRVRDSSLAIRPVKFGNVPLECLVLTLRSDADSPLPTFCFEPGKDSLRITSEYGNRVIIRNSVGTFQGKQVPIDVAVRAGEVMAATGHIEGLTARAVDASEVSTEGLTEKLYINSSPSMKGSLDKRVDPKYPDEAKRQHIAGTVVLHAIIGTDGHVHDLRLVSSPSAALTDASMDAVRRWTYTPYAVSGEARQVETTITVNFRFGS
jgi:TonB family protein